jgi:NRPS condensation-like uncharacterized protein
MEQHTSRWICMHVLPGIFFYNMTSNTLVCSHLLGVKTYKRHLERAHVHEREYLDSQIQSLKVPVMLWVDNYQVFQPKSYLEMKEDIWRNSKMCAVAAILVQHHLADGTVNEVDFNFKYIECDDRKGRLQLEPATPLLEELFTETFISFLGIDFYH